MYTEISKNQTIEEKKKTSSKEKQVEWSSSIVVIYVWIWSQTWDTKDNNFQWNCESISISSTKYHYLASFQSREHLSFKNIYELLAFDFFWRMLHLRDQYQNELLLHIITVFYYLPIFRFVSVVFFSLFHNINCNYIQVDERASVRITCTLHTVHMHAENDAKRKKNTHTQPNVIDFKNMIFGERLYCFHNSSWASKVYHWWCHAIMHPDEWNGCFFSSFVVILIIIKSIILCDCCFLFQVFM